MDFDRAAEHFVTLFDSSFLPLGMTLHGSLMSHGRPFHLWIVCMDEPVTEQLERIALPHVTLLPLREVENRGLREVKPGRSCREYCWTLTPFTFQAVFERHAGVGRITYLDADLFFFADPHILLDELDESGKHVLITEHAYAPEHIHFLPQSGRFCVQFLTFRRTAEAEKVMRWWQDKCLEWCFDRLDGDRFGDQKYLDAWPEIFGTEVHVVRQTEKTLAPWNVSFFESRGSGRLDPVFYHFQGLRIVGSNEVQLFNENYSVGKEGQRLYNEYLAGLRTSTSILKELGIPVPRLDGYMSLKGRLLKMVGCNPLYAKIG